ncbi:MAG: methyltransferase domain-containing protein, partial [Flavobacteriaceae bacterium]
VELANSTKMECEFVCSDVLKIPNKSHGKFDIVFISSGSIRWVPDLPNFFQIIETLLTHGGYLLITEMHPILNTIDGNKKIKLHKHIKHSYFKKEPFRDRQSLVYWEDQKYDPPPVYYFHHTLGEIITQCLYNKMSLSHFLEHPMDLSFGRFSRQGDIKLPLSFSLLARKGKR